MSTSNTLIDSLSAALATSGAIEWITPRLGTEEILVVAATRAAGDEFVRALAGPGSFGVHRYTLVQLASAMATPRLVERGVAPATRLAMEAIAARVTHEAFRHGRLAYFGPVAKCPGFAAALASTLNDLRLTRINAASLSGARAVGDIALLLDAYERELDRQRLADLASMLEIATAEVRAGSPLLLLDVPLPSRAHAEFVEALATKAPAVCATVLSADADRLSEFARILGKAPRLIIDSHDSALCRLRTNLFSAEPPPRSDYDSTVDLFSAPGEALEAVEIARRILRDGIAFDRVAILLRDPDRYQPLIEEALRRAGVPSYFSRGTARPDPAGRAFLALLACAGEGCSASRFAEYLSLGQVPPLDAAGAPPRREVPYAAPDDEMLATAGAAAAREPSPIPDATVVATPLAWEKLLVDAAVIGGYERWARRLRGLENEFRIQLESLTDEERSTRERIERELERLGHLERFALPLIEDLHALPRAADWGEWLRALSQLAARALVDPEPILAALNELRPMAEIGPVELEEVQTVLADRLRFLRREPPHRRYGRVFVGAIEEGRGRTFEVVYLPGLAEGLFPRRAAEDPLLLDELRTPISAALATRSHKVAEERLLLRTAAASAGTRFVASYPSMDLAQGRPRVPSFYALEIARAIEGRVPVLREFEKWLTENSEARLVWPAPPDAQHAIDDTEFDLAWLAAHRSASHLADANPHLARSLAVRRARWEPEWTAADGLVGPVQQQFRLSERAYSASALQDFAACPYRFVLHGMLHLEERKQAVALEQLDPLTRGALLHEVQFRFMREWRSHQSADLKAMLNEMLDSVAAEYAEKIAPAIERVWASELDDMRMDLGGWLTQWKAGLANWLPAHFELAFGLRPDSNHDDASTPDPVQCGPALLRGSIDLVEIDRDFDTVRVTDHKTGRPLEKPPTIIAGGSVMQPVLYALVAEKLTGKQASSGRLFYCTQRGNYQEYDIPIDDRARRFFARALDIIDDALASGFLPAAPARDACSLCDYRPVCGPHEEDRVKKWKDRSVLDGLNELRSMP